MNPYLKNLQKIEFVITYACTGKCRHCSEGAHEATGEHIDPAIAADAVRKITGAYPIQTVMTFGGEPLLCPEAVYAIMEAAREADVPRRQIITNGYFSKDPTRIREVAERLAACGVNDVLLSVDAFHQETIPLDVVKSFSTALVENGVCVRLQPAWLVSPTDKNPYNLRTRALLDCFADIGIRENEGNIIFPEGNAKKYLSEYFTESAVENPYIEDPKDVRCVSFDPDGGVFDRNLYREDIMDILASYAP